MFSLWLSGQWGEKKAGKIYRIEERGKREDDQPHIIPPSGGYFTLTQFVLGLCNRGQTLPGCPLASFVSFVKQRRRQYFETSWCVLV